MVRKETPTVKIVVFLTLVVSGKVPSNIMVNGRRHSYFLLTSRKTAPLHSAKKITNISGYWELETLVAQRTPSNFC